MSMNVILTRYHDLVFLEQPHDETTRLMAVELARRIASEVECIGESVHLTIGEIAHGTNEFSFQFCLRTLQYDDPHKLSVVQTEGLEIFTTEARQQYAAFYPSNPEKNYCGQIQMSVDMFNDEDDTGKVVVNPYATTILRLTYVHYCELIRQYFPDWETHYLNAPRYISRPKS